MRVQLCRMLLLACVVAGCSGTRNLPSSGGVADSPSASALLAKWTDRSMIAPVAVSSRSHDAAQSRRSALPPGQAQLIRLDGDLLRPQMASGRGGASKQPVEVALPRTASDPFHLSDTKSGVSVRVRLDGARAVAAEVAAGYVIYPNAHVSGAHVLHRPIAGGTEDYLAFEQRPDRSAVSYSIELGAGVAGLRLVASTLEFLDRGGAPRLRVSPPYLVDAHGTIHAATVALAGCAADTNPGAPWGRAVTPPGSDRCSLQIGWEGAEVAYPALLDPRWTATSNNMSAKRAEHSATLLNNGTVLVAGGLDPGIALTNTADLYDPGTNSFAATGSLANARFRHTATLLPNGDVLVAGGEVAGTLYTNTVERYHGGTWLQTEPNLPSVLSLHTASLIEGGSQSGKVLIVGGANVSPPHDVSTTQVLLYDPAGAGPGSFTTKASLTEAREAHSQVSESGGSRVVIAGGFTRTAGPADTFLTSTRVYDANNDGAGWTNAGAVVFGGGSSDGGPPMVRTANGQVLLYEGNSKATQLYTFGVVGWSAPVLTTFNHHFGAAALLSNGSVLLTGGVGDLKAELWDPNTLAWTTTDDLLVHRGDHTATSVGATVLLTGGTAFGGGTNNNGEVYAPSANGVACGANGECKGKCVAGNCVACAADGDCGSGHCVSGVCCNSACAPGPNETTSCTTGACVATCNAGYTDCDGNKLDGNGCETHSDADVNNCGGCGVVCSTNNIAVACGGGVCNGACNAGFADCNGNKQTDGCEVNTLTDPGHCGGCVTVCSNNNITTPTCGGGVCNGTCNAGFADCDSNKQSNGCEQNIATDPNHCGGCATVCSNNHIAVPTCGAGVCNGTCDTGFGDCDSNKQSNGCETDLKVNGNCGVCGRTCNVFDPCKINVCNVVAGTGQCSPISILTCGSSCSSAAGCGWVDSDNDGLNDTWESAGWIDNNCNGINNEAGIDTPLPGANVNEPDVYVKWDYMAKTGGGAHSHQPSPAAMAMVQDAYTSHHTHLHYFPTSDSITESATTVLGAAGSLPVGCTGADVVSFYDIKAAHFPSNLRPAYHYALFVHFNTCDTPADCATCPATAKTPAAPPFGLSGLGELPGNDFMVSFGSLTDMSVVIPDIVNAGTFMHELGHNISLRHGGGDDLVQKPNYLSVLNYSYQFGIGTSAAPGYYDTSTTDPSTDYHIDYSAFVGGTLHEGMTNGANACISDGSGGMDETVGLTGTAAGDKDVVVFYTDFGGTSQYAPSNGTAIDWDGSLPATDLHVYGDVSGDGVCSVLTGYNDWQQSVVGPVYQDTNMSLGFQCNTGFWADGASPHAQTIASQEMTAFQALEHGRIKGPGGLPFAKNCPAPGATVNGNLRIPANTSCVIIGSTVTGLVQIGSGAIFKAEYSVIRGHLQANGAQSVELDAASSVGGNVHLDSTAGVGLAGPVSGNVQITATRGNLAGGADYICTAKITGVMHLEGDTAAVHFDIGSAAHCTAGNQFGSNVQVVQNQGTVTVQNNDIRGNLQCTQNASITTAGNTVHGSELGQCTN